MGYAIKIVVPGELPDLNQYVKAAGASPGDRARLKAEIDARILNRFIAQAPGAKFEGRFVMWTNWYEADRKRDPDNVAFAKKFVLDALRKAGTIPGDGWKHIAGFKDLFFVDPDAPRVEVMLWASDKQEPIPKRAAKPLRRAAAAGGGKEGGGDGGDKG